MAKAPALRLPRLPVHGRLWSPPPNQPTGGGSPVAERSVHRTMNIDTFEALDHGA